jgi:hypothetical protein
MKYYALRRIRNKQILPHLFFTEREARQSPLANHYPESYTIVELSVEIEKENNIPSIYDTPGFAALRKREE